MLLLLSLKLPIIDSNSVVYISVKCPSVIIDLNKLVFNIVFKSIVESSLKRVKSLVNFKSKLLELRSILDSRFSLAKVVKVLLCFSSLVIYSKDFNKCVFKVGKGYKDSVSLRALFGQALL